VTTIVEKKGRIVLRILPVLLIISTTFCFGTQTYVHGKPKGISAVIFFSEENRKIIYRLVQSSRKKDIAQH
jgi:hypothetical protein